MTRMRQLIERADRQPLTPEEKIELQHLFIKLARNEADLMLNDVASDLIQ